MPMKYVVITNTFGREPNLVARSLKASLNQEFRPEKVILIDQNKPALEIDHTLLNNPRLEIQHVDAKCVSVARNRASYPTDIDWIVFCDDDGYMDKNYSKVLLDSIKEFPEVRIFAGSIIRDDNLGYYSPRHQIGGDINKFRNTKLLMGSNFAIHSKTFTELDKFDELFGTGSHWGSGEESDFAWKAFFSKVQMKYLQSLIVYHVKPYNGDLKHSIDKAYNYGIGKGALISKWLLKRKKLIVIYELVEMTLVPIIKCLKGLLKLNKAEILISLSSLKGRYIGIIKGYQFYRN